MKQSAARTLGVAVLGAAFAAAGAGVAHAAPTAPDGPLPIDSVAEAVPTPVADTAKTLPVEKAAETVPGAGHAPAQGQDTLGAGLNATRSVPARTGADGPTAPVAGLLGGLPVHQLPTQGLPLNGVPIG